MGRKGEVGPNLGDYQGGGGVGGKFAKGKTRRSSQATPYDRPPSSTRNSTSWLSKLLVDPAAKLLSFGVHRFIAAVLPPKRLASILPEEEQERRNVLKETALDPEVNAGVQEPVADVCGTSTSKNGTSGLPELEELLKQKTFTRSEIDRLTGLLKSRAVDLPVKDDRIGFELNPSGLDIGRHQEFPTAANINKSESLGTHRAVLDPAGTAGQHLEDQIASPAELAKAYMGSRPEKLSPSLLGLGGQMASEDSAPPSNSRYTLKSQLSSLPVKTSGYCGVPENGFTTPRSRGRSAIYNMARTPYSRLQPVTHQKVSGSIYSVDSRPPLSSSRPALGNGGQVASKPMALKRRSTIFDDDIGSIGPIRRIRQKHNLLSHEKSITISSEGPGSDFTHTPKRPFMGNADTGGTSTSSASYSHVPRESSMMAAKILEHLEKITPKEKSLESKLAAAREGSTFKLTQHMLRGQALRSMEDLDASKFLRNAHMDPKLVDLPVRRLPDSQKLTTQKQVSAEEMGPVKSVHSEDNLIPDRIGQGSNNVEKLTPAMPCFSSQPPEKKRPFKMSAHEDWIEMDEDCCHEHEPEIARKGLEEPMRDRKSALTDAKTLDKSPVSLERTRVLSRTELEEGNVMTGDKNTGFKLPTSFAANRSSQEVLSQSMKVGHSPLLQRSGSPTTINNPTSVESGVETSSSVKKVFPDATNAVIGVTESDSSGNKSSGLDNTLIGYIGEPLAPNLIATNNIKSVDAPSGNLASNDGSLTSSARLPFSSPAPASANLANQSFTNSSSSMASLLGATTNTSAFSDSVLVPANGTSSSFSESVSGNGFSNKLFSPPSTIGSTEAIDVKARTVNGLGNFSASSSISTFAGTSTGSNIFSVGTSSSAVNSQWPCSASGTSVSKESSLTGSGGGNVSLSTPVHFGSSSSATLSGLSGVTPVTSSSIFNSSVSATESDGTTQSSLSVPVSNKVNSINGAAPVGFEFGGGTSPSSEVIAFGSTTTESLGAFQFGASSATSASSSSSPSSSLFSFNAGSSAFSSATSTGSPATGVFSFGAGSSSSATSISNTSGVFNFGAGTSVSSSSANPVTSSSTAPAIFSSSGANSGSCASSLQDPKSSFGSPFSMPSSTGFSFGGSSASFGTSNSSVFGSTTGVPSNPTFAFSTAASSPLQFAGTQSVFGNSLSPFTTMPGSNNQMSVEDCMAEDPIQSSSPAAPVFGQSLVSPQSQISPSPPGFLFSSTAPSPVSPFQFGSQQSQIGQQNPSQFQPSASSEFNPGGSFSLGSGAGADKSGRRIVKASKSKNRKTR